MVSVDISYSIGISIHFIDEEIGCTLQDVLVFFSGANRVPPLGFDKRPSLTFLHNNAKLPTASTCDIRLRIPACYTQYQNFKEAMVLGVKGHVVCS